MDNDFTIVKSAFGRIRQNFINTFHDTLEAISTSNQMLEIEYCADGFLKNVLSTY